MTVENSDVTNGNTDGTETDEQFAPMDEDAQARFDANEPDKDDVKDESDDKDTTDGKEESDKGDESDDKSDSDESGDYEPYSLPEGFKDEDGTIAETLEDLGEVARSYDLNDEQAVELATVVSERMEAVIDETVDAYIEVEAEEFKEALDVQYDEMGKEKFTAMLTDSRRALDKIEHPEFKDLAMTTNLGSNPAVIGLLAEIYRKYMAEDRTNVGETHGFTNKPKTTAEKIFG